MADSIVRAGAPDAFHSTPGMTDYVDPMGPMTQGPAAPAPPPPAPAAPTPVPGSPPPGQGTAEQNDALGLINSNLSQLGLPASLAAWAWGEIQKGVPSSQVLLDLEATPEFNARFPAIATLRARAAKGENVHVPTPGEYKSFEDTNTGLMRAAGLAPGFYDQPGDFTKFIEGGVSPAEVSSRIALAASASRTAPPEVRDFLAKEGLAPGDVTAFFLDPARGDLVAAQARYTTAEIGGAAKHAGFDLSVGQASGLQAGGTTGAQATAGFDQAGVMKSLFSNTVGEAETGTGVGVADVVGAVGNDPAAQARIAAAKARRSAQFEGGGGAGGASGTGGTGLGGSGR